MDLTSTPAWRALAAHFDAEGRSFELRQLFADDRGRAERLSAGPADLFLDDSRHWVTDPIAFTTVLGFLRTGTSESVARARAIRTDDSA
jgi:glucose-6-phosphate isomerase